MEMNEYQEQARTTAVYPNIGNNIYYPALGVGGEAGETLNVVSKIMRDYGDEVTPEMKHRLIHEMGDVMWNIANLCCEIDVSLEEVAQYNLDMLKSRQKRGKLQGSGDDR